MHFKVHLDRMKTKVTNVVGQLRRVLKCEWGMSKRAVRMVYKGLFVACVMYGSSVWCEYEFKVCKGFNEWMPKDCVVGEYD